MKQLFHKSGVYLGVLISVQPVWGEGPDGVEYEQKSGLQGMISRSDVFVMDHDQIELAYRHAHEDEEG